MVTGTQSEGKEDCLLLFSSQLYHLRLLPLMPISLHIKTCVDLVGSEVAYLKS